jgi:hypothetical protein
VSLPPLAGGTRSGPAAVRVGLAVKADVMGFLQ